MDKAFFRNIALPAYRVAVFYCLLDMEHHLIERQVEVGVVLTVVGNLQGEVLAVRVMGEAGERYILFRVAYAVGELQRGIFGTEHVNMLGRHVAYLLTKEIVEIILQLSEPRLL